MFGLYLVVCLWCVFVYVSCVCAIYIQWFAFCQTYALMLHICNKNIIRASQLQPALQSSSAQALFVCVFVCQSALYACRGGGEHHRSQVASGVNHLANIMYNIHTRYSTRNVSDRVPRVLWIHCETSSSGMHIYSPAAKISAALYGYTRICILYITRATVNMPDHGRFAKSYDEKRNWAFCHSFKTYLFVIFCWST